MPSESPKAEPFAVDGKVIGVYHPKTNTFKKKVSRKRHFFWKLGSWGFDLDVLMVLRERGCQSIEILEKDKQDVFKVSMDTLLREGIPGNFGHGKQVFLHESFFDTKRGPIRQDEFEFSK